MKEFWESTWLNGFRAPIFAGFIAMLVTVFATPAVKWLAIRCGAVDDPKRDDRRVHTEPIPRWGGIAIFLGIFLALAIAIPLAMPKTLFPQYLVGMLVVSAILVVIGALDDLFSYSSKVQILYLLAAGVVIQFIGDEKTVVQIRGIDWPMFVPGGQWVEFAPWVAIPLTAIYIFVVTKTMDTIDGVDGLAAGIAAIAASTLAIIAATKGEQPRVALIAAAIAGSAIGFLRHNYNPAKIFMGTGGAQVFGFLLACLSIIGAMKTAAAMALFIPMLVFGVPIFDAFWVVIRRLRSGEPIFQADKRHLHHTLLSRGLSQRQTVWVLYTVAIVLSGALVVLVVTRG